MKKIENIVKEMEEQFKPLLRGRNFKGFYQYLETFETGETESYCWRFYISGFTSDNSKGYILKWDQTYELVEFDEHDRICIDGKFYGRRYWNH